MPGDVGKEREGLVRLLAIDFGTSNTVAALLVPGQAARVIAFGDSPLLPSAVFAAADGTLATGREALRQARLDPTRFEPNPKRRIDDGEILLGDRVFPVVRVISAVLRTVAVEVRRQLGGAMPDEVRLTHPAQWGAARQNVLASAAREAGLGAGKLVLLPEPVAAAAQYTRLPGRSVPPGGTVAVYDLGGGTFDVAVVGRITGRTESDGFAVLAEEGLNDLGGLDFDQALADHIGRSASAADPVRWQQLRRPRDAASRRAARGLAEDIMAAKEALSRYPQTEIALPAPFADEHITRSEFEGLIRPNLLRSVELLAATLARAGVAPATLGGVFLVGGSSRIPLVAGLIQDRLRITPVALDQPETAVALGALLMPFQRDGRTTALTGPPRPAPPSRPVPPVSGPVSGPVPAGTPTGSWTPPAPDRRRRRRGLVIGGAAVAAAVVAALVVLLVVDPFRGADPVGTTGPSTSLPPSSASAGSTGGSSGAGQGTGGVFTADELTFLGPSGSRLINCSDQTQAFDDAVPEGFRGRRVVRCEQPDPGDISGRTLVYTITPDGGPAAWLSQLVAARHVGTDDTERDNLDVTSDSGQGKVRMVTATELPALGNLSSGSRGVPALAWTIGESRYVGVITVQAYTSTRDLTAFWEAAYKPR